MRQLYNINGSYASSVKKWLDKYFIGINIFTAIVIILVCAYYIYTNNWLWAVFSLFALSLFAIKNKYYKEFIKDLASLRRGISGEDIVAESLENSKLFGDYWYIRNYTNKAACYGDIDGILLGPKGMFLLEVKNWQGSFRVSGTDMYRHISKDLYKLYKSPINQLVDNQERVLHYLESRGINSVNLRSFVVLVGGRLESFRGSTGVYVTTADEIANKIISSPDHHFSTDQVNKILDALKLEITGDTYSLKI